MIAQLDTKSVYTFIKALDHALVQVAKSMGYDVLGIMDVDNLYGALWIYRSLSGPQAQPRLFRNWPEGNETIPFRWSPVNEGLPKIHSDVDRRDGEEQFREDVAPYRSEVIVPALLLLVAAHENELRLAVLCCHVGDMHC